MTSSARATLALAGFLAFTLPLMPVQWLLIKAGSRHGRRFPHWYHRQLCRLLGIRVHRHGAVPDDTPVLIISNHVTWLDIPVLSAVAPLSFVAKKEVGNWPLAGSLARLQRTVFVDRGRRTSVGTTANEMTERLQAGDHVVLFAEGTSSDGNRVLPFKTSLFAAAKPAGPGEDAADDGAGSGKTVYVQPVAIAYTGMHGLPLTRRERPLVAWYGDMEMTSHAWELLKSGPIDVHVHIGEPVPLNSFSDRKALARYAETAVRTALLRILRGRAPGEVIEAAAPPQAWSRPPVHRRATADGKKWL